MSKANFFVVGMGSSAGGLEAYQNLLPNLSSDKACYVICQHLSPHHKSMLREILERSTKIDVVDIVNALPIEAGKIYVTPPSYNLLVKEGAFVLDPPHAESLPKPNVNDFFTSLGKYYGECSVGVILSGSGSDGSMGLAALHANGGLSVVQEPETCGYDSMPKAAIRTTNVDYVGSPQEIGEYIDTYVNGAAKNLNKSLPANTFAAVTEYIFSKTGINFSQYRTSTIERRLARRMAIKRMNESEQYLRFLQKNEAEVSSFVQDAFIQVSEFFRDPEAFDLLARTLEERLKKNSDLHEFRIWVPACAEGEEAYTIAIIIDEIIRKNDLTLKFKIFATDVATSAVSRARRGRYDLDHCQKIPPEYVARYFDRDGDQLIARSIIRDNVVFSVHNLLSDPPFSKIDLLSCRNLLIYLNVPLQEETIDVFNYALNPDGFLLLGSAESLRDNVAFDIISKQDKFYKKKHFTSAVILANKFKPKTSLSDAGQKNKPAIDFKREFFSSLLKQYSPVACVLDDNDSIIFCHGDIDNFMQVHDGQYSSNLIDRIQQSMRAELRALIYKCRRTLDEVSTTAKRTDDLGQEALVKIKVSGFSVHKPGWVCVIFERLDARNSIDDIIEDNAVPDKHIFRELEQELSTTRENLQTVVEELETANEQLQVYNEELQSSNEEYQSTNEELQTVNEELQSTNEELITVNEELSHKNFQQERLANDILNIQESLDVPLFLLDKDFRLQRYTKPCSDLIDMSRVRVEDVFFALPWRMKMPDLSGLINKVVEEGKIKDVELDLGEKIMRCRVAPYINGMNDKDGVVIAFYDITLLTDAKRALALEKDVADVTLSTLNEGVIRVGDGFVVEYANNAVDSLCQWKANECLNKDIVEYISLFSEGEQVDLKKLIKHAVSTNEVYSTEDSFFKLKTRFGEEKLVELAIKPLNQKGVMTDTLVIITLNDVTDRQKYLDSLVWSSKHDSLTGLVNRKEAEVRIKNAVHNARESLIESTLLYLDLDQFKVVNDTCGHVAGDQLLRQLSSLIGEEIRSRDTLARMGGDEFVVLLEHCKILRAEKVAKAILDAVSSYTFSWESKLFKVGVSIGIVAINESVQNVSRVLADADAACYSAKEAGRNRVRIHDKHNDLLNLQRSQMRVITDITEALDEGGFRLYFQRLSSLSDTTDVWEALVRMFNKKGEFLLPERFLPAAERFGCIDRIDRWVINHIVELFEQYFDADLLPILNINVSAITLANEAYLEEVTRVLSDHKLPAHKICFELTETAAMVNLHSAKEFINKVRMLGCRVALDDFGTGTSSLAYLRELEVDMVKIDGMFARSLGTGDVNESIVDAVTQVAHKLNIHVVVEAIENAKQVEVLKNFGVEFAQGNYLAPPVPLEEFVSNYRNNQDSTALVESV